MQSLPSRAGCARTLRYPVGAVCFYLKRGLEVLSRGGNTQPQARCPKPSSPPHRRAIWQAMRPYASLPSWGCVFPSQRKTTCLPPGWKHTTPSEPRVGRTLPPPPSLRHMGSRYANQPRPRNIPTQPRMLCSDCVLCEKLEGPSDRQPSRQP